MHVIGCVHKHKIKEEKKIIEWRGRGGGRRGSWSGRGPFSHLPPWQRPGRIYGYGRGGYISRDYGYRNPYVCQRFPWLSRWWWADPSNKTSPIYPPSPDPSAELKRLEAERDALMKDIEMMKKHVEAGTTPVTWPTIPFGPTTFPTASREQEKQFLEQQQNAILAQTEAIKKRLEELGK